MCARVPPIITQARMKLVDLLRSRPYIPYSTAPHEDSMWPHCAEHWFAMDHAKAWAFTNDEEPPNAERQAYKTLTEEHQFPTYAKRGDFILANACPEPLENVDYDTMETFHWESYVSVAVELYQNLFDKDYIRKIGFAMDDLHGFAEVPMIFYLTVLAPPMNAMKNNITTGLISCLLSSGWEGIGDWRH